MRVIEQYLDVSKTVHRIDDLGPEGSAEPPESPTGQFLARVLGA